MEKKKDYIIIHKSDIRGVVNRVTQEVMDSYHSPFTEVKITSNEFIVDTKDIKVKKLLKAKEVKRGFIGFLQEKIADELIDFLSERTVNKD